MPGPAMPTRELLGLAVVLVALITTSGKSSLLPGDRSSMAGWERPKNGKGGQKKYPKQTESLFWRGGEGDKATQRRCSGVGEGGPEQTLCSWCRVLLPCVLCSVELLVQSLGGRAVGEGLGDGVDEQAFASWPLCQWLVLLLLVLAGKAGHRHCLIPPVPTSRVSALFQGQSWMKGMA